MYNQMAGLPARLQSAARTLPLPLLVLLLALSTVFLFGNDRGHFYRPGHHDWVSSERMAMVANLSPARNFLIFYNQVLQADGTVGYDPYQRFPIGGYALLKLGTIPFAGDLSARIYAARMLMLLFFAGSALLAYLILCRLLASQWAALTTTLLAFSSYYALYYNDMVSVEVGIDLFGVMLTGHGIILFIQENRFRQLLIKACCALLLGWHVYALLLPFIALGLTNELIKSRAGLLTVRPSPPTFGRLKHYGAALLSSRYLLLGVATLLFGIAVLAFNFITEYLALDGATSLIDLPSVQSMLERVGAIDSDFVNRAGHPVEWPRFIRDQLARIGIVSIPSAMPGAMDTFQIGFARSENGVSSVIIGVGVLGVCLAGLFFTRHKILLATAILSGFCWALPMRKFVFHHDFEALFYIGIPLVFYALIISCAHRSRRAIINYYGLSAFAVFIFVLSSFQVGQVGYMDVPTDPSYPDAEFHKDLIADFEAIRSITSGASIFVPRRRADPRFSGAAYADTYYLSGNILGYLPTFKETELFGRAGTFLEYLSELEEPRVSDFDFVIVSGNNINRKGSLTPENRRMFLYDATAQSQRYFDLSDPAIESTYNVYHIWNYLVYASRERECENRANPDARFFLHITPSHRHDLPAKRRQYGYANWDFHFTDYAWNIGGRCVALLQLPTYDVAAIRTGQYAAEGRLWEGAYRLAQRL